MAGSTLPTAAARALELLHLDGRAGVFELLLELGSLVLRHAFLDRLRRALDQILGLLEAEAGDRAHFLDHVDLLFTGRGEHDGELGLLLDGSRGGTAARTRG